MMTKTLRTKPRLPFCWWCSRRLFGWRHREIEIDGIKRILHVGCAEPAERDDCSMLLDEFAEEAA